MNLLAALILEFTNPPARRNAAWPKSTLNRRALRVANETLLAQIEKIRQQTRDAEGGHH